MPKDRNRNGRCIAILFKNIGVRGQCDSPDRMLLIVLLDQVERLHQMVMEGVVVSGSGVD